MGPCLKYFSQGPLLHFCFSTNSSHILKVEIKLSKTCSREIKGPLDLAPQIDEWLEGYFNGKPSNSLPLLFPRLTSFQENVIQKLSNQPFGQKLSYRDLATLSLNPKASRAVGTVCRTNLFPLLVPCHRVIRKNGQIGQYNGGVEIKKRLLSFEGAL